MASIWKVVEKRSLLKRGLRMTTKNTPKTQAQFINLCQDLMFKIFFSRNEKLLLSLAQTFIFQPKGKTIETLEVTNKAEGENWIKEAGIALRNSSILPKLPGGKGVVLDILATLNTGESVNIEMQTMFHAHFKERILYYWSEIYGSDFKSGEGYGTLKPAYSLVFVNFPLFEGDLKLQPIPKGVPCVPADSAVLSFSIRSDKPPHFVLTEHLGMTIVDLSWFKVPEGDFRDIVDMMSAWCYFIKGSSSLTEESRKILFKQSEVFKMAESALKDLSVDSSVRVLEKLREKWVRDQVTDLEYAVQKGRKEGMEKGMEKGALAERQAVALNMLKEQVDIAFICKVTGLSAEEINKLK